MSKYLACSLVGVLALVSVMPATATTVDVTNASQVTLGTGDSLLFYVSSSLPSTHGPAYPGEIEMLLGGMPLGGPVDSVPGTSSVYMPGILFTGAIESPNGGLSMPLADSNAARMGLPAGDLLLTPGSHSGGSYSGPVDLLSGVA